MPPKRSKNAGKKRQSQIMSFFGGTKKPSTPAKSGEKRSEEKEVISQTKRRRIAKDTYSDEENAKENVPSNKMPKGPEKSETGQRTPLKTNSSSAMEEDTPSKRRSARLSSTPVKAEKSSQKSQSKSVERNGAKKSKASSPKAGPEKKENNKKTATTAKKEKKGSKGPPSPKKKKTTQSSSAEDTKSDDTPNPTIEVGKTIVEKKFKKKTYRGTVTSYSKPYYNIVYEDGDEEEMEEEEVLTHMVPTSNDEEDTPTTTRGAGKSSKTRKNLNKKSATETKKDVSSDKTSATKGDQQSNEDTVRSRRRSSRTTNSVSYKEESVSDEESAGEDSGSELEFDENQIKEEEEAEDEESEEAPEESESEMSIVSEPGDDICEVFKKKMTNGDLKKKKSRKSTSKRSFGGPTKGSRGRDTCGDWDDLPVLVKPQDMFNDLVGRVPEIKDFAKSLGRPLRVATMCSGTESPLLALNMISKAAKDLFGVTLKIEHVFSCEIEPFKQAYIERNFTPPLLFRDIRELGREKATTAYGAEMVVPGNVDMLVAGTSCVDYSNLNNDKKDLDAAGESGQTFRGMIQWVKKFQPPIVILENVCGAPWERVCERFQSIDYHADFMRVDTKFHYIPHTRTRGYMMATRGTKAHDVPEQWKAKVRELERPSSSTLEAFILPSDDPRVHSARRMLSKKTKEDGTARAQVDWARCESRHQRARLEEMLGVKRPLTGWEEGGMCHLSDFAWNDWGKAQVDRVLDLMDINALRLAKDGIDANYKTMVWNLSQNVDRSTASSRPGICPCLTPSMVPFVTNRGGPLIGLEALSLQGIPVDDLLLTRESEDNMADLAGNAMSSTVVGTCMLAALVLNNAALQEVPWAGKDSKKKRKADKMSEDDSEAVEARLNQIVGEEELNRIPLALGDSNEVSLAALLRDAQRSARKCPCEGRAGTAVAVMQECRKCGHTACVQCGGRPEHSYEALDPDSEEGLRVPPRDFEQTLKAALPMRVCLKGFDNESLMKLRPKGVKANDKSWKEWVEIVSGLHLQELLFCTLERGAVWTANYTGQNAKMELVLDKVSPEWKVTVLNTGVARKNPLHDLLSRPVARLRIDPEASSLISGEWQVCLPAQHDLTLEVEGVGEQVESWKAWLGLQGEFSQQKRWSALQISVAEDEEELVDGRLSGRFELLATCATATGNLHKQVVRDGERPLYLFLDPTRAGNVNEDSFVFAYDHRRLAYGEQRGHVISVSPEWRPSSKSGKKKVKCRTTGQWQPLESAVFETVTAQGSLALPQSRLDLTLSSDACDAALAVVSCEVPLSQCAADQKDKIWSTGSWETLDLQRSKERFEALAWFTQRLSIPGSLTNWNEGGAVDMMDTLCDPEARSPCDKCAPAPPDVLFVNVGGNKIEPREHPQQACVYEQRLKNRPHAFIVQLCKDGELGKMRLGVNVASLVHRAIADLPAARRSPNELNYSWRLVPHSDHAVVTFAKLQLTSNRKDPSAPQPPHFKKFPLRPEQQRSLWWMMQQESNPPTFQEEEVTEAVLGPLGWRAEAKATVPVQIHGGIVADQVGYGKTVITLGLIDSCSEPPSFPEDMAIGHVPVHTTLILAPPHLMKQWPKEVVKFTGKHFKVAVIKTMADLNRLTIKDVMDADMVVAATTVLRSDLYFKRMGELAGNGEEIPNKAGRLFEAIYAKKLQSLQERVAELQSEEQGPKVVSEAVKAGRKHKQDLLENTVELRTNLGNTEKRLSLGKSKKATYKSEKDGQKSNKKSKKTVSKKKGQSESEEDSFVEDSDEEEIVSKKKTKKKSKQKPAPKSEGDVWGLDTTAVRKDWRQMKSPPFELFAWHRVVVDEFTYLNTRDQSAILNLSALNRWCLSGTPPVGDFKDIKGMAAFLGLNLGVSEATSTKQLKDRTRAEKFAFFKDMHTQEWHGRRHRLAQEFLDKFVRQNIAEIDEIKAEEHLEEIILTPAERAIYLELDHHLQAMDMKTKKSIKSKRDRDNDRTARLRLMLGGSSSAEEALLKRCSHYDLAGATKSAEAACDNIIQVRQDQLDDCKKEICDSFKQAKEMRETIMKKDSSYRTDPEEPFMRWVRSLELSGEEGCGDEEAAETLRNLLDEAGVQIESLKKDKKSTSGGTGSSKKDSEALLAQKWDLREHVHGLRRLQKELVGRVRSLRYFVGVRDLQQKDLQVNCPACDQTLASKSEIALLSCCGHMGCVSCLLQHADKQECPTSGCNAPARLSSVVKASALGADQEHEAAGEYGTKLAKVVEKIESLPEDDRILVFVQFPDLMQQVADALDASGIKTLQLKGSVHKKTAALEIMQKEKMEKDDPRVLLLFLHDESASGANLTNANHAIFVHPLLANTQQEYTQAETQSIGRIRRYGQKKTVHVWRFLAVDTMDTKIFNERSRDWDDGMRR